jgi:hypothetical protein
LQFDPLVGRGGCGRGGKPTLAGLVGHLDGLAEMRDRLLEG